jgi:hypothetical protein
MPACGWLQRVRHNTTAVNFAALLQLCMYVQQAMLYMYSAPMQILMQIDRTVCSEVLTAVGGSPTRISW